MRRSAMDVPAHRDQLARDPHAAIGCAGRRKPALTYVLAISWRPADMDADCVHLAGTIAPNPDRTSVMSQTRVDAVVEGMRREKIEPLGVLPHGSEGLVAGIASDMQKPMGPHLSQTRGAQRGETEYARKAAERPGRFDEAEIGQRIARRHKALRRIQMHCRLRSERRGTDTIATGRNAVPPRHR